MEIINSNISGIGDWGLGIGDWGLAQSPIPNTHKTFLKN
jgi:hypothetical protein